MSEVAPKYSIHERIVDVLRTHPEGISLPRIREELGLDTREHGQLDRRLRELDARYVITRQRQGHDTLYTIAGERTEPLDSEGIDQKTRARILHFAGGRCQMCGRTVAEHNVTLHVDHKVPRRWGGKTVDENLWALCRECNEGKKAFFASITDERVQHALVHPSVHMRLGELLKAFKGQPVPKEYLHLVASTTHDDWEKRLRELRELGWEYSVSKRSESKRLRVYFTLRNWQPWPDDISGAIRRSEAERGAKRSRHYQA